MKKSVILVGILLMLVSASFISSAVTITKEDNKTYPTGRYVKFFFGPVDVQTSADFKTATTFIKKLLIIKDTATQIFAWDIISGNMYIDTQSGSVKLGPGSSFVAKSGILAYSGIDQTDGLTTLMKILSAYFRVTIIDLTKISGQAWGVKIYSPEPI